MLAWKIDPLLLCSKNGLSSDGSAFFSLFRCNKSASICEICGHLCPIPGTPHIALELQMLLRDFKPMVVGSILLQGPLGPLNPEPRPPCFCTFPSVFSGFWNKALRFPIVLGTSIINPLGAFCCNFAAPRGVLGENDDTPVQNNSTELNPPVDFTSFMRRYQDMVFSTAARLTGNETQAEDISQEVFLKAYEHWENLQTSPAAGGWLKTVATNLSLNHLQRYRKRWRFFSEFSRSDAGESEEDETPVEFAAPDTFFNELNNSERQEWIEKALEELPQNQRVPLVLFHFDDMSYDEIADRLGISLAKVKTDILRGRNALAKILTRGAGREQIS
jgi:RNA polymerase sigma-70 factor (ECF subfamily)